MRRLVVGLGNPLAGDDGFGPHVLARLRDEAELPADVELVGASTDLLGLVEELHRYAQVVLVDAIVGGDGTPGEVLVLEEQTVLAWKARSSHAHALSPVEALRVFRALHPHAPTRIVLVALHTDALGDQVLHATPQAIREGVRSVHGLLAT